MLIFTRLPLLKCSNTVYNIQYIIFIVFFILGILNERSTISIFSLQIKVVILKSKKKTKTHEIFFVEGGGMEVV